MPSVHLHSDHPQGEVLSRVERIPGFARKLAPLGRVRDLYRRVQRSPDGFGLEGLLAEMRIGLRVDEADRSRIPATGPVVVVANHPYGVLDGAVLALLLSRVRPDVRVLTNSLLGDIPELERHCIFVDPFQTDRSIESNRTAVRQALAWLRRGGMLAIFPAGEVSHWQMPAAQVADPAWNHTAVRLIRRTGASAVPVYFCGQNGVGFQILGMIHPTLRSAFLLQEFLQQEGKSIEVRVGSEISCEALKSVPDDREAIEYLRWRTYLLARRNKPEASWPSALRSKLVAKIQQPLATPIPPETLACEIAGLGQDRCLAESGDFVVYLARAREIPQLILDLGRIRELTFRSAGEGSAKARDLDSFDDYYWHLLLWNKKKRGPALERGRSFVHPQYQRQYAPLLLLWKGIARLVATHPETPVLFGAVSISNEYTHASREMIYRFFQSRMQDDDLAGLVQP